MRSTMLIGDQSSYIFDSLSFTNEDTSNTFVSVVNPLSTKNLSTHVTHILDNTLGLVFWCSFIIVLTIMLQMSSLKFSSFSFIFYYNIFYTNNIIFIINLKEFGGIYCVEITKVIFILINLETLIIDG